MLRNSWICTATAGIALMLIASPAPANAVGPLKKGAEWCVRNPAKCRAAANEIGRKAKRKFERARTTAEGLAIDLAENTLDAIDNVCGPIDKMKRSVRRVRKIRRIDQLHKLVLDESGQD